MYRAPDINPNVFYKEACSREYLRSEVRDHNQPNDLWVIIFNEVFDLTELYQRNRHTIMMWPIMAFGGKDISNWFDDMTGELRTYIDPITNTMHHIAPHGRFIHVEPPYITTEWVNDFGLPWWMDKKRYVIGRIADRTCFVRFFNTLTGQKFQLEVSARDPLLHIIRKHIFEFNAHTASYTCKYDQRTLDLEKSLEENGINIDTEIMEEVDMDPELWPVELLLYFNDDLTVY